MPAVLKLLLLLAAAVCFVLGAANVPAKVNWVALGLLLWVIVPLVAAVEGLH